MALLVFVKRGQSRLRRPARPSLLGDGVLDRIRSTSLALLGLSTAVGLGLVAFALQLGWSVAPNLPIPGAPQGKQARVAGAVVAPPPRWGLGAAAQDSSPAANHPGGSGSHPKVIPVDSRTAPTSADATQVASPASPVVEPPSHAGAPPQTPASPPPQVAPAPATVIATTTPNPVPAPAPAATPPVSAGVGSAEGELKEEEDAEASPEESAPSHGYPDEHGHSTDHGGGYHGHWHRH
jgi:hypothetical protein